MVLFSFLLREASPVSEALGKRLAVASSESAAAVFKLAIATRISVLASSAKLMSRVSSGSSHEAHQALASSTLGDWLTGREAFQLDPRAFCSISVICSEVAQPVTKRVTAASATRVFENFGICIVGLYKENFFSSKCTHSLSKDMSNKCKEVKRDAPNRVSYG